MNLFKNLILLAGIALAGCSTQRQLVSDRKPVEIDNMLILKPLTRVEMINKGNRAEYSPELSAEVASTIAAEVDNLLPAHIKRQKLDIDSVGVQELYRELYLIASSVEKSRNVKGTRLSENMVALLDTYGYDYAMGVLNFGFTRAKGNYGKQIAKGVGVGILTLGMVVPVPVKAYSTMICYIIDKPNNNIAFYRKDMAQDREPTDPHGIHDQVGKLLVPYFHASAK